MRVYLIPTPEQATREEYAAVDALPDELRKLLREAPVELSARKVLLAWVRCDGDTAALLPRLHAWIAKEVERADKK